jgi:coenzyme PQQ precursor peptide PqqA
MTNGVTWETPVVEEIQCGMEVTAYAPAVEVAAAADDADR